MACVQVTPRRCRRRRRCRAPQQAQRLGLGFGFGFRLGLGPNPNPRPYDPNRLSRHGDVASVADGGAAAGPRCTAQQPSCCLERLGLGLGLGVSVRVRI